MQERRQTVRLYFLVPALILLFGMPAYASDPGTGLDSTTIEVNLPYAVKGADVLRAFMKAEKAEVAYVRVKAYPSRVRYTLGSGKQPFGPQVDRVVVIVTLQAVSVPMGVRTELALEKQYRLLVFKALGSDFRFRNRDAFEAFLAVVHETLQADDLVHKEE